MMTLRKIVFWSHLVVGLLTAAFVLLLCLTGALLAFELQIISLAERDIRAAPPTNDAPFLSGAEIIREAKKISAERITLIQWHSDSAAPAHVFTDKQTTIKLNPYTGEFLGHGAPRLRGFMRWVTALHTHLTITDWGHWLVASANVGFAFLLLSGLWLWWPKTWRWSSLRNSLRPRSDLSGKARYWNWHNALGFWLLPFLLIISLSGIVLAFKPVDQWWRHFGAAEILAPATAPIRPARAAESTVGWPDWVSRISRDHPGWASLVVHGENAIAKAPRLTVQVLHGTIRQSRQTVELRLDLSQGQILEERDWNTGDGPQRARNVIRTGHTGELFGDWGQVFAFITCIGGLLIICTGVALSWRRLFDKSADGEAPEGRKP